MKVKLLLSAALCLFSSMAMATSYETVVTTGQGETLDQAIDVGLRRAVEQVSGVSIDSARISTTTYSSDEKGSSAKEAMIDGTHMSAKGDVKYRVLSEKCLNDFCNVRLEVSVKVDPRDKVKDQNANRRTIAVGNFTGPKGATITNKVKDLLVQDRKFKVLNDKSDPSLQYLVTGKVVTANTHKRVVDNSRTVELTGEEIKDVKTYYNSKVVIEFKILDVMHNQIKWSATIPTTSSRNNLSLLVDLAAKKVFNQLKDNIYPLVVLVGDNGSIVLNSGGETVKTGEYYDVFTLGEKFVDPITKESLGRDESKVATVKVTKVLSKLSYVKVVKGESSAVKTNSIARKSSYRPATKKTSSSKPKPKAAPVEEKSVGIIL
ncbi:hypothetical protein H2O73_15815 [Vibrio sp. 404]|uniref:Periplasmic protein n=1 Tax=Vibrio marinisediminis TaxID=2758441 RepID=A0A7W2FT94_9VIBR|nr:hypothetical protein [Vibrio marinisediminis]MBA5763832.1 hypothetical protein [Vibrio marinisediminis]